MSSTNNTTAFQTNSRANAPDMTPDHFAPLFSDNSKRASLQGGMAIEIAAACFLALLLGWSSLSYPLGADQGVLAVWAQELARGAVPYRDIWEQRPPLFYFLICFGYLAGLREHLLVRLVDLILQIATAGVLSALGRRWFGRGAGVLTGFLYAFSYFGMVSYWHQSQPESLYGLLLGLAFLLLDPWIQKAEDTPAWNFANKTRCFGAGVCCGLAFLSKYPIVLCLPVFFYVLFIKHALRACLWRWALWTMGALTPIILLCAWFWAIGALRNFVIDTIVFNFFHASRGVEGSAIADGVLRYYSPGILELFQGFVFLLLDKKEIIAPLLLLLIVKLPRRVGCGAFNRPSNSVRAMNCGEGILLITISALAFRGSRSRCPRLFSATTWRRRTFSGLSKAAAINCCSLAAALSFNTWPTFSPRRDLL